MARRKDNLHSYEKERSPLLVGLYIAVLLALIGCIVFFVYRSRQQQQNYQDSIYDISRGDPVQTEHLRERETESETEAETETLTEAMTETESELQSGAETEPESDTEAELPGEAETEPEADAAAASALAETESETEEMLPAGAPRLRLSEDKVVIQVEDTFNPTDYVEEITDDMDNIYSLWRDIQVEGHYDTESAGIYQLVYYVIDSSGYRSNREVLLLEVQDPQTEARDETADESESESETERRTAASRRNAG